MRGIELTPILYVGTFKNSAGLTEKGAVTYLYNIKKKEKKGKRGVVGGVHVPAALCGGYAYNWGIYQLVIFS